MGSTGVDEKRSKPEAECICCGSTEFVSLYDDLEDYELGIPVGELSMIQCAGCRLVQLDPMPSQEELNTFYPTEYCDHFAHDRGFLRHAYRRFFGARARQIASFVPPDGAVLDVGCSAGYLLSLLREFRPDLDLNGVEMRAEAVALGRKRGLNIVQGAIEDVNLPSNHYDLILLNALIEHLRDPRALLMQLRSYLKVGGKIFIVTCNTDCLDFRVFGKYWGVLHIPRHTVLFDAGNLGALLEQCGYRASAVRFSASPIGWALGIQNFASAKMQLAKKGGRAKFYFPVLILLLPMVLLQKVFGRTAIMAMVADKEAQS